MKLPKVSESGGDFIVPEPGVYKLEFTHYDDPVISAFKKQNGDDAWRIKLEFTVRDDESEFDGAQIYAWYGWTMHPKGNLYPVVKALLGRDIEEDEEPDLDDLLGKYIMGTLDNKTKKSDSGERTFANLVAASPVRKRKDAGNGAKRATSDDGAADATASWTSFWEDVTKAGFPRDKAAIERVIGDLGEDPGDALYRFRLNEAELQAAFA